MHTHTKACPSHPHETTDRPNVQVRVDEPGSKSEAITPVRLMASSMTGEFLRSDAFLEYPDPVTGITKQFCSLTRDDQMCLLSPYPASTSIQTRRASARRIGSTYAYDFLGLMEVSLIQKWDKHLKDLHSTFPSRGDEKIPEQVRALRCGAVWQACLGLGVGLGGAGRGLGLWLGGVSGAVSSNHLCMYVCMYSCCMCTTHNMIALQRR